MWTCCESPITDEGRQCTMHRVPDNYVPLEASEGAKSAQKCKAREANFEPEDHPEFAWCESCKKEVRTAHIDSKPCVWRMKSMMTPKYRFATKSKYTADRKAWMTRDMHLGSDGVVATNQDMINMEAKMVDTTLKGSLLEEVVYLGDNNVGPYFRWTLR